MDCKWLIYIVVGLQLCMVEAGAAYEAAVANQKQQQRERAADADAAMLQIGDCASELTEMMISDSQDYM